MKVRLASYSILVLVLMLLIAACSPAASPTTAPPTAAPPTAAPPTSAPAPATSAPEPTAAPAMAEYTAPCTLEAANKPIPDGKLRLVIGTGGTGGVYFPYGGGIARILTEKMGNTEVTAEVTGGSVDNNKLVNSGDADLGMSTIDSAYIAVKGEGVYKDTGPIPACTLATLYTSFFHVVALEDSGINTIADMKGKRISVGSAGSSTEVLADRAMEAAGLNPKADVTRDNLSVAESVAAMKDRKIDAFFWIGGLPTSAVTDLVSTAGLKVKFVDTSGLVKPLQEKWGPVYTAFNLPAKTYAGFDQDIPGIGIGNILLVNANMNPELAYRILKTLFDNVDQIRAVHPEAKKFTVESAAVGSSIPYHPGAIKFYKEKGAWPRQ